MKKSFFWCAWKVLSVLHETRDEEEKQRMRWNKKRWCEGAARCVKKKLGKKNYRCTWNFCPLAWGKMRPRLHWERSRSAATEPCRCSRPFARRPGTATQNVRTAGNNAKINVREADEKLVHFFCSFSWMAIPGYGVCLPWLQVRLAGSGGKSAASRIDAEVLGLKGVYFVCSLCTVHVSR